MYDVIFRSDKDKSNFVILHNNIGIVQAMKLREVSGDLIVYHDTQHVVPNKIWLFDWERKNPASYAHRCITAG